MGPWRVFRGLWPPMSSMMDPSAFSALVPFDVRPSRAILLDVAVV
jgi:hypothetical protein